MSLSVALNAEVAVGIERQIKLKLGAVQFVAANTGHVGFGARISYI